MLLNTFITRPEIARLINLDCLTYAGNLSNLEKVKGHPKYIFEKVDLRDRPAVVRALSEHQITHVLHLAAESHVDQSIAKPVTFIQTNIVGTFNLLEACRTVWGARFRATAFIMCRPMRSMAALEQLSGLPKRHRTRPTRPTPRAKRPAICWFVPISARTGSPQ